MILVFWVAVGLVLFTYAGYPLLIWTLSKLRPRSWLQADVTPSVSVIMAVHNGAALLLQKLEHLRQLDYPNVAEVIVVSDGSSDDTDQLLLQYAAQDTGCKAIVLEEQSGKATALNRGIELATADILLFVDIRPWLGESSVRHLMSNFADRGVGCVAGELIVENSGGDASTDAVGGMYWKYEQWLRDCEARFDSPLGVYGGYYAVRRALVEKFPAGAILDDMYQPLSVVRKGYRSVIDSQAKVYDTWPKTAADEFRRKVRTLAGNFQLIELAPWLLGPSNRLWVQLVCHKLLRLCVPLFLAAALGASAWLGVVRHSLVFATAALLQLGFYAVGLWGKHLPIAGFKKLAGVAEAFCMLNFAVVVAFYQYLFLPRPLWKTLWNKPHIAGGAQSENKLGAVAGQ